MVYISLEYWHVYDLTRLDFYMALLQREYETNWESYDIPWPVFQRAIGKCSFRFYEYCERVHNAPGDIAEATYCLLRFYRHHFVAHLQRFKTISFHQFKDMAEAFCVFLMEGPRIVIKYTKTTDKLAFFFGREHDHEEEEEEEEEEEHDHDLSAFQDVLDMLIDDDNE
jgi:hypothetical protein